MVATGPVVMDLEQTGLAAMDKVTDKGETGLATTVVVDQVIMVLEETVLEETAVAPEEAAVQAAAAAVAVAVV